MGGVCHADYLTSAGHRIPGFFFQVDWLKVTFLKEAETAVRY